RLRFVEHVRAREQAKLGCLADHVHFQAVAHVGFFESLPHGAVDETDGGKVLHAAEADRTDIAKEQLHDAERIGAADAGEHGGLAAGGEHFGGNIKADLVGVAVRHHAAEAAAAGHAKPARVVDDDEVDAPRLRTLGADAGPRPAADDRLPGGDLGS